MAFGYWEGRNRVYGYRLTHEFPHFKEVSPEPKRWSTWENIYSVDKRHSQHNSKKSAKECAICCEDWGHLGYLRRDFEQHEGKKAVCVNIELEKV